MGLIMGLGCPSLSLLYGHLLLPVWPPSRGGSVWARRQTRNQQPLATVTRRPTSTPQQSATASFPSGIWSLGASFQVSSLCFWVAVVMGQQLTSAHFCSWLATWHPPKSRPFLAMFCTLLPQCRQRFRPVHSLQPMVAPLMCRCPVTAQVLLAARVIPTRQLPLLFHAPDVNSS